MEKCYVGHAHINHGSSNVTARYVTLRCGSNRSSHVHCWQNRECSYKRTRCVSALSLSHILMSPQSLLDKFQETLCAFSRTYKILSAMTDNGKHISLSFSSPFSLFTSGSNYMVISNCTTCAFLMSLPEPLFRAAEKEWIAFIESLTDILIQVDPQLPPLPPKDLIRRIYRDVGLLSFSLPLFSSLPPDSFQQRQDPLQTSLFCLLFKNRQKGHLCRL